MELDANQMNFDLEEQKAHDVPASMSRDEAVAFARGLHKRAEDLAAVSMVLQMEADNGWNRQQNVQNLQQIAANKYRFAGAILTHCGETAIEIPHPEFFEQKEA